ncbi:MAG TPA: PKD domain-containing protein, partial [Arthrobacter sp.]|nr:PKD domain-containing protein [Arthrobacter sp.]
DGSYTVKLVVTSDDGTTARTEQAIEVANLAPTAAYTLTADGATVTVDAGASSDPEGTALDFAWDFGDGTTGAGVKASHKYAKDGDYDIRLTVTDAGGATGTSIQTATVVVDPVEPPVQPKAFATDSFGRQQASGWGTADSGGTWTTAGSSSYFTVSGGAGKVNMPSAGSGRQAYLGADWSDLEYRALIGNDKAATGGGVYHYAVLRNVPGVGSYRAKIRFRSDGTVAASLEKIVSGTASQVTPETTIAGLKATPGGKLQLRAQILQGDKTSMQLKLWSTAGNEPETWQISATDGTASLQHGGGIGFGVYLSGSATNAPITAELDNLWVGEVTPDE